MVVLVALLTPLAVPAASTGGYEIAHIVEHTCDPGGALIVTDAYKRARDRDRTITEPGEVIACPSAGATEKFQIAAGPEGIGRERYFCTFSSLRNGDGADLCLLSKTVGEVPLLQPLLIVRTESTNRLTVVGLVSEDANRVQLDPSTGAAGATVLRIDPQRAANIGAGGAFSYFWLSMNRRALCTGDLPHLRARDSSGDSIAASAIPESTRLLDATDRVLHSQPLKALCGPRRGRLLPADSGWLPQLTALLGSVLAELW